MRKRALAMKWIGNFENGLKDEHCKPCWKLLVSRALRCGEKKFQRMAEVDSV
jgi:hypothetical protein